MAGHLQDLYGGSVQVNQVEVGLNSSSLQGLKLYEEGPGGESWAEVEDAEADVSLLQLARGSATPRRPGDLRRQRQQPAVRFPELGTAGDRLLHLPQRQRWTSRRWWWGFRWARLRSTCR